MTSELWCISLDPINIDNKFARFSEHWRPKRIARLNGQEVKLAKVKGVFPWHRHETAEEMFLVWHGRLFVDYRDRRVELGPGEMTVVPRGVEHRTAADEETLILIFEPAGIRNTGDVDSPEFTAPQGVEL